MKIILHRFSPQAIGLIPNIVEEYEDVFIVTEIRQKKLFINFDQTKIYYLEELNLVSLSALIKKERLEYCIENIITLDEDLMLLASSLNCEYSLSEKAQLPFNASIYTNKYYMRQVLKNKKVDQPMFCYCDENNKSHVFSKLNNSETYVLKPLNESGAKGISIGNPFKLQSLVNGAAIIESFIPHKKMYTTDGIFIGSNLVAFYINEYDQPIINSLKNKNGHITRSVSKKCTLNQQEELFRMTKRVISAFNTTEVRPFHFEWFLTYDNQFLFCEGAARFGGKICKLIKTCYGADLFKIYWDLILGNSTYPTIQLPSSLPKKIGFNYAAYKWEGVIDKFCKSPYEVNYHVKLGDYLESSKDILEPLFTIDFECISEIEYQQHIICIEQFYKDLKEVNDIV